MKLQFKIQDYQTDAVNSVVDVFRGQPFHSGINYQIDPGRRAPNAVLSLLDDEVDAGLRNADIALTEIEILENIAHLQKAQYLPVSPTLVRSKAAPQAPNLDIEMETGTGKTYVYIKTIMELNARYGWSKFIVVVPSIAIREGVKKTFDITADHFLQHYGTKPRAFIYNSSQLHEIERFSSDSGVQVMIINIQAFNSSGKDNRRIHVALDDFQSRKPIDVIAANRPIVIIDEPQKISADKAQSSLSSFNALMVLRYSATHKQEHNKIHRLDAVDAYNKKLVKKIGVRGITVRGLAGTTAYLYLEGIETRRGASPIARLELEVQTKSGIKRQLKRLDKGSNLHDISNGLEAYKDLFITDIDATRDIVELSNGDVVVAGQLADRDVTEDAKRRIQIREVISAHIDKERQLFSKGIKVLSLFFVDEVAKYRDYSQEDTLGEYARIFEEEYKKARDEVLAELNIDEAYQQYLQRDTVDKVHEGYFSIDKKSNHQVDGKISGRGENKGLSDDTDAYDLILKDKERLLSFDEPVRFIFSHSALREGWDNPNVFVMGMLKKSDNTVSRRQEIGRGLRLAVNQHGERMDESTVGDLVHQINQLTVVTDESYTDFVNGLQKEIAESLSARPRKVKISSLEGKLLSTENGEEYIDPATAAHIIVYLDSNEYIDTEGFLTPLYSEARENDAMAEPPQGLRMPFEALLKVVDTFRPGYPTPEDDRKPKKVPFNEENFYKAEFQELWNRINRKSAYTVEFDSEELVRKCVSALDQSLIVAGMQYVVHRGEQQSTLDEAALSDKSGFTVSTSKTHHETVSASSQVKYDLLGEIAEKTTLTRRTVSKILQRVTPETFAKFRLNPEQFITESAKIINEQKASVIVEHLTYRVLEDKYESTVFTENQAKQNLGKLGEPLKKHVYEYAVTDSDVERRFARELDASEEVSVYAKLPKGFFITTPVGDYNPDWAIAFNEGDVKHIYFVAETKGTMQSLQLQVIENAKIECARKHFKALSNTINKSVKYDVIDSYQHLMALMSS